MNKILACIITFSSFVGVVNAQVEGKPDMQPAGQEGKSGMHQGRQKMMENMNLTEAQKQQMKSIQIDFKAKMEALDKNDNMNVKDYKSQKEALIQNRKAQMQAVLTADQKEQLHTLKHEQENGHKGEGAVKGKDLGLTKEQRNEIRDQMQAMKSKMDAIKNNMSLTPEQKKEQMKALKASNKEAFKNILTPEQIEKMKVDKNTQADNK